ncbi:DNA-binding transcriptional regulator, LysR family [Andreprevotia lacus DSM 23236]|jgi:DNA-binding transcriptional LysR family regulator|uniref:DNA-binding transcriptional regulator, LysR family n=1 Tax=Andreprevotia lacus DSM 23236 TaxID=1121001 RepID=A0A1W1Y139_9NEIS|nr:LysR family transcriptional regulator [Andreprevotia lacus]SMC29834.1 DNA-binding transcriptional regulator, LysR family [Andreprevotia lacus DSM 23236]
MDRLAAMQVFAKVVEAGSFVRAAEQLDISTTAASRLVGELENHLNARLLQRTTRKLSLTEAGRAYYERASQILADLAETEAMLDSETAQPAGVLRLNAPVAFGVRHLATILPRYQAQYPQVKIELTLSDRTVDLVEEGYDLALRISSQLAGNLVARRLAPIRVVACGAPAYLATHGAPHIPADLSTHNCLIYTYGSIGDEWRFSRDGVAQSVKVAGSLRANNGDLLVAAACAGAGLIHEPTFLVGADLESGRLQQVLADYQSPELALHAVYPSRRHLSAKVRSFIDFLLLEWGDAPPWDAWLNTR